MCHACVGSAVQISTCSSPSLDSSFLPPLALQLGRKKITLSEISEALAETSNRLNSYFLNPELWTSRSFFQFRDPGFFKTVSQLSHYISTVADHCGEETLPKCRSSIRYPSYILSPTLSRRHQQRCPATIRLSLTQSSADAAAAVLVA